MLNNFPMYLDTSRVKKDWLPILSDFFDSEIGQSLRDFLQSRMQSGAVIYPPSPFRALELTSFAQTRIVIMGQDPYHGPGQAQGLAFHVAANCKIPPSLKNIHKELFRDLQIAAPATGELFGWAEQGVLLLNAVLSVEEGKPASHAKKGWEVLTDRLLAALAEDQTPKVFMLWGNYAQSKEQLIQSFASNHLILKANHPSPLSALRPPVPFIGCGHFSAANRWLVSQNRTPIDWSSFGTSATPGQQSFDF